MPWLWNLVDIMNSALFQIRYGKRLRNIEKVKLLAFENHFVKKGKYRVVPIRDIKADVMTNFFSRQPTEAYRFFKPHGFDVKSIKKLQKNRAFIGYVLEDVVNGRIAGYCFNRSFFHGKGFRGRMVDMDYRGRGLGTMMNYLLNEVGFGIGLRLFETVSKDNVASYKSAISASPFRVVEELPQNELFLEIINDTKQGNEMNKNIMGGGKTQVIRLQPHFNAYTEQERMAA